MIPNGVFHAQEVPLHSRNVDISGSSTSISHRNSVHNLAEENKSRHPDNENYRSRKQLSVMFDVWNSTCRLDNVKLFANTPDTAVSLIHSSTFVISRSEITSSTNTSPFVIGDSRMDSSVSVSIISCSHRSSSESSSLLPLVSGPRSSSCSSQMRSNEEGHADAFGAGSLSIVGSDLSMKSKHLVIGTGPLFDFGKCFGNGLTGVVGCSVSLSSSSLTNTTSTRLPSTFTSSLSFVTQRLIGVSVSDSTNHLCGTSGMRMDWSGSSLLSNCSFSSCVTTNDAPDPIAEPIPEPGQEIDEITQTERIYLFQAMDNETEANQIWIHSCHFADILYSTYPCHGAAIFIQYKRADIIIKTCSFTRCHAAHSLGVGGAVYLLYPSSSDAKQYSTTLFNCQFTNNTAQFGGHLCLQDYVPVTVAQCTFAESGPRVDPDTDQYSSVRVTLSGDCRFDNCTLSDNEGLSVGGIEIHQSSSTGKIVLTDVLFANNLRTSGTPSRRVTDFLFYFDTGIENSEFFDCFSTSTPIHCASRSAEKIYPDLIGPSIISVDQTIQENANGDGFEVVLSFNGVFTGSSRKYDVTFEDADGSEFVAKAMSFSKTAGIATFALNNPSVSGLSSSTVYSIVKVEKSASEAASNDFVEGGVTEPDWTWWHHTLESRAGNMVGMSFTTPAGPTLTNIKADLNPSNLNEGKVSVTINNILAGSYNLVVFDSSDPLKTEITIGPFSFTASNTETTKTLTVVIHPSHELSYGKTYTVKTLSSSTLIVSHTGQTLTMPDAPARISLANPTLSGVNGTSVTLSLTGAALPCDSDLTIVVKEMEGDVIKEGASEITLTGTIEGTSGSTATTCSVSVEIYNKTETLEYSLRYKIISLSIVGLKCIVDPTATFKVPDSPGRIENVVRTILDGLRTSVSVVVKGVNLPSSISTVTVMHQTSLVSSTSVVWNSESQLTVSMTVYVNPSLVFSIASLLKTASSDLHSENYDVIVVSLAGKSIPQSAQISITIVEVTEGNTQTGESFEIEGFSSLTQEQLSHSLSSPISTQLQHGKRYEITQCDITNQETVLDGRVFFRVPSPPILTGVGFSFATSSNTTFHLIVEGTDLPAGETFVVSLDGFDEEIEVTFANTNEGSSAELALGWSNTLQFDTAYPLLSVIHKDTPTLLIHPADLTLLTQPRPNPLILYATDSANSDPKFCGAVDRPCSSVDVAWLIVETYSAQRVSLVLMKKALLASQPVIESGQDFIVKNDLLPPTLVIPSTVSLGDSAGLVSVAGTLVLKEVNIDVQIAALSFVLFDVKGGELEMDSVHISGAPSSSELVDGIEGLCSWETGLIKLHDAMMETHSCVLSSIGMGEIRMESSNLSLISTQILSNGARFSSFPSAQQDVMCKSGNISILPNSSDTTDDHWISSTSDCSVVLNGSEVKSPNFVPSLDVKNCRSTLSKKKDSFSVSIVVESWNETDIALSVPSSSLPSLSSNVKWTAWIVFGKDQHTDSFTFLESLKDRKAQALQQSLPWLIPVIIGSAVLLLAIVVVVIVLICRRRKAAKSDSEKLLSKQELNEVDEVKMEVEMPPYHTTNGVIAHKLDDPQTVFPSDEIKYTFAGFNEPQARQIEIPVEAIQCEGQFAVVTVDGQDTLYNRIHKGDGVGEGKRREIERKIVRGMLKMVEKHNLESGTRISPHWILLNRNDSVFIRVESGLEKKEDQEKRSLPSNSHPSLSRSGVKDGIEEIRWRAPEQGEKEGEMKEGVEASKVMVFRLGLIVWEIETGLVPFGELDAVNAHRNLGAGIGLPLQKVSDGSMRELIEGCLQIDADQRITLQQVL
ncbi:hypothetical protein BLNAU_20714 [Blattamonas nauphoetae]|uniref:Protein kinase domain-containing protein n=1 Tax=Blattamonas nauphoetae TaxID=2049346 RepID=A0ABQ9WXY8_9EUKA|nr:hypothetical protein BLNAU_20714 [Blattamonas nauphoetae]